MQPLWKMVCQGLKKLNIGLLPDPAIPLPGKYSPTQAAIMKYQRLVAYTTELLSYEKGDSFWRLEV